MLRRVNEREICALAGCPHASECNVDLRKCGEDFTKVGSPTDEAILLLDLIDVPTLKVEDDAGATFGSLEGFLSANEDDEGTCDEVRDLDPGHSVELDCACGAHTTVTRLW